MNYRVSGALAIVRVGDADIYLSRGATLPDGVDKDNLKHLMSVGLVEEAKAETDAAEEADETDAADESEQPADEAPKTTCRR